MLKISCKPRNLSISPYLWTRWSGPLIILWFLIIFSSIFIRWILMFEWKTFAYYDFTKFLLILKGHFLLSPDCKHVKICIPDLLHTGHCHFGFFSFIIRYKDASKHCRWSQVEERHGVVILILPRKFGKKILVRFYIKIN